MASDMSQLSVRLEKADRDALAHVAWVKGVDLADEIRTAVGEHLAALRVDEDFLRREQQRIERQRAAFRGNTTEASSADGEP